MRQHEKELFLARIRCGYYIYKGKKVTLYLYPPTKEQSYEVQFVFSEAYNEALADGSMVEEELLEMLEEQVESKYTGRRSSATQLIREGKWLGIQ